MRYSLVIDGAHGDELAELERDARTLLETREGTQPADRGFGLSWRCLDGLPDVSESLFVAELHEKLERYEPRLEVDDVGFVWDGEGRMQPHIRLKRKGGGGWERR